MRDLAEMRSDEPYGAVVIDAPRSTPVVLMEFVPRQPGSRGWLGMMGPTSNGLKVKGTLLPNSHCSNGQLAENKK